MSCCKAKDHKHREGPQHLRKVTHMRRSFGISLRVNEILMKRDRKNRSSQDMHRHGTMKKRFSIHSNTPCLLERRISEHPHFKQTTGFIAASIQRGFLRWWVDITAVLRKSPTGGLICGEEGVAKAVYELAIPFRRPKIYFEMVNFS